MYIVIDVGGTKTRVAASDDLASFGEPVVFDTPREYGRGMETLAETVAGAASGGKIEALNMGIRGVLADDKRTLSRDTLLFDWAEKPLSADLSRLTGAQAVYLENDTALVGLGESVYGAGKGASIVAYITVSTGVGGVRIVDGCIDRAAHGFEIGGQYLSWKENMTFENLVSGSSLEKRRGVHPREIPPDDPVWEEIALLTAYGVHNTILHWSPERVVLGGSMFNEVGISIERVRAHVASVMHKFPAVPEIVHSSLGDLGGLWGGLAHLRRHC